MNVTIHTHGEEQPTLAAEVNTETDWNPWLRLSIRPNTKVGFNMPSDITVHLSGLSIDEGYAFSDSWDEAGHALREWVNYRSTVENMDVES